MANNKLLENPPDTKGIMAKRGYLLHFVVSTFQFAVSLQINKSVARTLNVDLMGEDEIE